LPVIDRSRSSVRAHVPCMFKSLTKKRVPHRWETCRKTTTTTVPRRASVEGYKAFFSEFLTRFLSSPPSPEGLNDPAARRGPRSTLTSTRLTQPSGPIVNLSAGIGLRPGRVPGTASAFQGACKNKSRYPPAGEVQAQ